MIISDITLTNITTPNNKQMVYAKTSGCPEE